MEPVSTPRAPKAIGPYVQAIADGDLLFCSGQIAIDPATGKLDGTDAAAQTRRVLANLRAVLEAGGARLDTVLKTTVFLADLKDFPAVNAAYAEAFGAHRPARATVQVAGLPMGALVEIDAIARRAR